jgi:hypothetical protein
MEQSCSYYLQFEGRCREEWVRLGLGSRVLTLSRTGPYLETPSTRIEATSVQISRELRDEHESGVVGYFEGNGGEMALLTWFANKPQSDCPAPLGADENSPARPEARNERRRASAG